jgi:hypothetical protein
MQLPGTGIELVSGCCAKGYAKADTYGFSSVTVDGPSDLPFLLMPMCGRTARRTM